MLLVSLLLSYANIVYLKNEPKRIHLEIVHPEYVFVLLLFW